ncbi:alpha/beta hydrolase family protein [Halomonas organivorans]|uniref:Pimeloyl-ACP methyl ester carboxylesterase n=1 Tax=Halomonas organivorans TaxID=257772 RepID=A0A7W5BVP5_9GAMM|nr:acyl-CoA thioester hydrolase/BAAT C-terminal domain-containing protein [Halomonas organivorans]MBB3140017.1 pimeloyl-ACP methyl ester carboxylesterase [Halomonas organivorans]
MLNIVRRLLPAFGTTYGPAGDGPFPGILILHGSEGGFSGWSHRLAVLFAAHGFLAYPHAYSRGGNAWNAGAIEEVALDRTAEALAALREFAYCSGRVGLYGVSRGGEHALLLASLMAEEGRAGQADALAAHASADVVCGAFDARSFRDSGDPGWQAWDAASRAWTWRGSSERLKPTTRIEIERYAGPVLLSHGVEDATWSVDMTRRLAERLAARKGHVETHFYEGEGHMLRSEAENLHHERLLRFFSRFLV